MNEKLEARFAAVKKIVDELDYAGLLEKDATADEYDGESVLVSLCALCSLLPILLYNGRRGARNPLFTFLFYAAYPLHLLALVAIRAMRLVPPYFLR